MDQNIGMIDKFWEFFIMNFYKICRVFLMENFIYGLTRSRFCYGPVVHIAQNQNKPIIFSGKIRRRLIRNSVQ
jgi:hypothetical protein